MKHLLPLVMLALFFVTAPGAAPAQVLRRIGAPRQVDVSIDTNWPAVSPDAKWLGRDSYNALSIRSLPALGEGPDASKLADAALLKFGLDGPLALRWSADSKFVWAAVYPWPEGPMRPAQVSAETGLLTELPAPKIGSAQLDGILYVDGEGLGVARYNFSNNTREFGPPTLALVNFGAGTVIAKLSLSDPIPLAAGGETTLDQPDFEDADAVGLASGGVRFVGALGSAPNKSSWLVWDTAGSARIFPRMRGWPLDRVALSPDGAKLLAGRNLQGTAPCGYDVASCSIPSKPDTGPSLIAYDATTGRELWRRSEGPIDWFAPTRAVFSPDGRYAVVALPVGARPAEKACIGIISMTDGKLITAAPVAFYDMRLQLLADGRTLVVSTIEHVEVFDIDWSASGSPGRCA